MASDTNRKRLTIRYFSWIRERIGKYSEDVAPPNDVADIASLIAWLVQTGDETYAYAFENPTVTRAAIDRHHVPYTASIEGATEIAFFPPMTGG